jgi:hypothetical protein
MADADDTAEQDEVLVLDVGAEAADADAAAELGEDPVLDVVAADAGPVLAEDEEDHLDLH